MKKLIRIETLYTKKFILHICRNEEYLNSSLTEKQKEIFERFKDCQTVSVINSTFMQGKKEECEEKLAVMIAQKNAEIAAEKERLKAEQSA